VLNDNYTKVERLSNYYRIWNVPMKAIKETAIPQEPCCTSCAACGDEGPKENQAQTTKGRIIRLGIGAVLLAVGLVLENLLPNTSLQWTGSHLLSTSISFPLSDVSLPLTALLVFLCGYLLLGGKIIVRAARSVAKGKVFNELFLMAIATIGAFVIGEAAEAVAVMLFYQVGEFFQDSAVQKSRSSIARLMDIRPDYANVWRNSSACADSGGTCGCACEGTPTDDTDDVRSREGVVGAHGSITKVTPDTVQTGEIIIVKPGERVPLDGIVIEGEALLDTAALTGESIPRKVSVSDTVLSGCINQNGVLTIRTTQTFGESTVAKIIDLAENAVSRKSPTENFITTFARYYTPVVVGLAALIAIVPPLVMGGQWIDWLYRALILLVISCPCALVISIPLSYFCGISVSSRRGILVKGGNYLEALSKLETVVFDKTGTLSKGVFQVTEILPASSFDSDELLEAAACAEVFSNHPIALSVLREYARNIDSSSLSGYREMAGLGVCVNAGGKTICAGNQKLMAQIGVVLTEVQAESKSIGAEISAGAGTGAEISAGEGTGAETSAGASTIVHVALDGVYTGRIIISDELKPDSISTIAALKRKGINKIILLSGDNLRATKAVAEELGLEEAYGSLLPHEKVEQVELLLERQKTKGKPSVKGKLAFVGDGINDAPVLAMADVGIAMGGLGSDAAVEAADVVFMTDEPSKLIEAIDVARYTKRIVWQNIIFALGIKAIFLMLGALGVIDMWEAVFADVGVSLLAILNTMRILSGAYLGKAIGSRMTAVP